MRRTTLFADDSMLNDLRRVAEERGMSLAEVIRQALRQFLRQYHTSPSRLSLLGAGRSKRRDVGERAEELLWKR